MTTLEQTIIFYGSFFLGLVYGLAIMYFRGY
jgi:hypothetical protein